MSKKFLHKKLTNHILLTLFTAFCFVITTEGQAVKCTDLKNDCMTAKTRELACKTYNQDGSTFYIEQICNNIWKDFEEQPPRNPVFAHEQGCSTAYYRAKNDQKCEK